LAILWTGRERSAAMAKLIRCECGFVARGDTDDEVVAAIREHMAADHPALLDSVSRDDLIGWIQFD
jgi:predicted small metal-binding protein